MIFRSSRSLMFFKIGVLKNFGTSTRITSVLALAGFLLHNTYGSCFWIFAAGNTFFQLNLVFIADSCTDIRSKLLWKYGLNFSSNHWNSSVKKGVIGNAANFTGKRLCWSLCSSIKKRLQRRCFPVEFKKFLRTLNLRSANECFWNLLFHLVPFLITHTSGSD